MTAKCISGWFPSEHFLHPSTAVSHQLFPTCKILKGWKMRALYYLLSLLRESENFIGITFPEQSHFLGEVLPTFTVQLPINRDGLLSPLLQASVQLLLSFYLSY